MGSECEYISVVLTPPLPLPSPPSFPLSPCHSDDRVKYLNSDTRLCEYISFKCTDMNDICNCDLKLPIPPFPLEIRLYTQVERDRKKTNVSHLNVLHVPHSAPQLAARREKRSGWLMDTSCTLVLLSGLV